MWFSVKFGTALRCDTKRVLRKPVASACTKNEVCRTRTISAELLSLLATQSSTSLSKNLFMEAMERGLLGKILAFADYSDKAAD